MKEEKDLGVIIQDTIIPYRHMNEFLASTYETLINITMTFNYMGKSMLKRS